MRIGIVGTGNIGRTVAEHLVAAGHEVALGNSRGPESLADLVAELGANATAATPEDAVEFGEVVVLAIPFRHREDLPNADLFAGKIVADAMNPYTEDFGVMDLDTPSSRLVAEQFPDARVVKAFNTMYWETLREEARPDADPANRLALFVAGDDDAAEATVADLIAEIGFAPVDTGSLGDSTIQEPGSPIYNEPMTKPEAQKRLRELRE
jgi:predicted dinucleotide-binding enzyme